MPTAAVVLDAAAWIVDVNPAAERATGYPRGLLVGRFVGTVAIPRVADTHQPHWHELMAGRYDRHDLSGALRHADGTLRPIRLAIALIRDGTGRPDGGVALVHPPDMPTARRPSAAEVAVLTRLAAGCGIQQIADDLCLTRRGVDYRIAQLRRKLRADGPDGAPATSAALVARAYSLGVLSPGVWPPHPDVGMVHGH